MLNPYTIGLKLIENLSSNPEKPRLFYGWVIAGIAFTSLLIRFGILNTFGVFLVPLEKEFGWNRGLVSGAQSLVMVMIGVGGPVVGYFLQRWGPRRVIAISALLLGLVLALTSQTKQIWHFYLLWGLLGGMGHGFQSMVPWTALVSSWFIRKRGLALGIAMAGIGIGYFAIVPLTQFMISNYDWQTAIIVLGGVLALGIAPASAIFVREKPEDMGLLPDGEKHIEKARQEKQNDKIAISNDEEWTAKRALRTSSFWLLCLAFATTLFSINMMLAHQVAFLIDVGFKASMAAFVFGIVGIASVPSRIIWGFLLDRLGPVRTYALTTLIVLGGIFSLLSTSDPSQPWLAYIYAILWGSGYGTTVIVIAVMSANFYQGKNLGLIFGFVTLIGQILGSPGAWVGGYLFDLNGNYNLAFSLAILSGAVSCALLWTASISKKRSMHPLRGAP